MGLVRYAARELARELDSKSKDFYEFVMPAVDMYENGNDLVIAIDLPGFAKKDINLRLTEGVLSIDASRAEEENFGTVYFRHRPTKIHKKILLPFSAKDDEKVLGKATYSEGVVTIKIPIPKSTNIPIT